MKFVCDSKYNQFLFDLYINRINGYHQSSFKQYIYKIREKNTVIFYFYNRLQNIFAIYYVSQKILIWSKSLTLLFDYFQQDNYKIEFLMRILGTRL